MRKKERKDTGRPRVVIAHRKPNGPQAFVLLKDLSCLIRNLVWDRQASKEAKGGMDIDRIADTSIKAEGIEADGPKTLATIRRRCTVAMYRYYDRRRVIREQWGTVRVWGLA